MKWIVAYISAIAISVLLAIFSGHVFGTIDNRTALICLLAGLFTAGFIIKQYPNLSTGLERKDFKFWSIVTIVIFALFSLKSFLWIAYKAGNDISVQSDNNLGDMGLHISFINYFANSPPFWPDNHIVAGEKVRYPIGMDLFNSLLVMSGIDLFRGLIWVGLLCAIATAVALLVWGRSFALAGFLFNGGFAGFQFFQKFIFKDYQSQIAWRSIPVTMFVTQRGLLYSIPAGLLLLISWRERYFGKEQNENKNANTLLPFWVEVLLYSVMPIFHAHSFIFLSITLGIWLIFTKKENKITIIKFLAFSFPVAVFLMGLIADQSKTSSLIYIKLGWMQEKQDFFKFWIYNTGIFWPLVILLCLEIPALPRLMKANIQEALNKFKESRVIVLSAVFLFILFCNVMMAPWDWDNSKLLIWSYIILLPYLWRNLISHWNIVIKYIVCFLLFFSGFVCLIGGIKSPKGHKLFDFHEVTKVERVVKTLHIEDRFASYPTFNHPLLFCGHKVVLGYLGWMWSHGYNTKQTEEKLKRLMLGEDNWQELAKELGVRYIFWGELERKEYRDSKKPWESTTKKIASGFWGSIYDLAPKSKNDFDSDFQPF